tara:strand:- start:3624 stop:4319 length:696 start_codon:yes stop_codon:yes gene_type:complete
MTIKKFAFAIFVAIATTSCSGTYRAYYDTLKIAFTEPKDATMTLEQINKSKIDLMSVTRGERPAAIMALAYIENGQHKWVSGDNAMFIMEQGRVVRTLGLDKNLIYLSSTSSDPLKTISNPSLSSGQPSPSIWQRSADWSGDEYGYPITSSFDRPTSKTIQVLGKAVETILYVENVNYEAPSDYLRFDEKWQNYFWFDKRSGSLVKSVQTSSPMSEKVEFVYLSRIARLNP